MTATAVPLGAGIAEPPDRNGAFPRLTEEHCGRLRVDSGAAV